MIERENRRNISPEPSSSAMDLSIVGRHVLLFDDDASAAFINSVDALLPWSANPSLLLDRYDVRHLLSDLPPRPKTRRAPPPAEPGVVSESDLDRERYEDLPNKDEGAEPSRDPSKSGTYGAVGFSYGTDHDASNNPGGSEPGLAFPGYRPPFPVPEKLLASLPPSEKLHEIISRTALFVSKHGGQSEIILRVKQGDNPTFGFLMPDHSLHPYFRFLVDHPELLAPDNDNPRKNVNKADNVEDSSDGLAAGALSLLGSFYGTEEEEDRSQKVPSDSRTMESVDIVPSTSSTNSDLPDVLEHPTQIMKRNEPDVSITIKNENSVSLEVKSSAAAGNASDAHAKKLVPDVSRPVVTSMNKHQTLTSSSVLEDKLTTTSVLQDNLPILEPPNFLKTAVDKIVEFIVRNGKQFEAVLVAQDKPHGRFPFLLKSNPFHPYYLKVLQEAQESKVLEKDSKSRKHDSERHASSNKRGKEAARSKDSDGSQTGSGRSIGRESSVVSQPPVASDLERKEKFKMVLSGTKKEAQDQASKPVQRQGGASLDAAAQIVFAATRGLAYQKPNVVENVGQTSSGVAHPSKSIGSLSVSPHGYNTLSKPNSNLEPGEILPNEHATARRTAGGNDVSVAKVMAKTAALDVANEADSSEACLTSEQKRKAERLRRAKMFGAMLKSGSSKTSGSLPHLSAPLSNSGVSDLLGSSGKLPISNLADAERVDTIYRELDGSIVLVDADPLSVKESEKKDSAKESDEQHAEKHHSKSRRHDEESDDRKHSGKKHRSKGSSRYSDEDEDSEEDSKRLKRDKHRSRSRKHDDEDLDDKHSKKRHRHSGSSRHDGDEHDRIHSSSKDRESKSRHKSRHHSHSEHGHQHRHESRSESTSRPEKHSSRSLAKMDDVQSDDLKGLNNGAASNAAEVPDELRQKIRAMLLANM